MQKRYEAVEEYTAKLMNEGKVAFSPIVHCHHMSINHDLPKTFDFWENWCIGMLDKATEVHLLCMDGYLDSKGVKSELAYSDELGIPFTAIPILI